MCRWGTPTWLQTLNGYKVQTFKPNIIPNGCQLDDCILICFLQTLILHSPRTNTLIQGLSGFSLYHFYLLVQYGMKQGNTTTYGTSFSHAAVQTVKTKILGKQLASTRQAVMLQYCSILLHHLHSQMNVLFWVTHLAPSQPPMIVNCSRTWSNLRNSLRLDVRWNVSEMTYFYLRIKL